MYTQCTCLIIGILCIWVDTLFCYMISWFSDWLTPVTAAESMRDYLSRGPLWTVECLCVAMLEHYSGKKA